MGLSRTVSKINPNFSENHNFSHPVYFASQLLDLGTGAACQKPTMMGLLGRERSLTLSSAVWIQYTNVTDGRTDRLTDTGRLQRPRLRIASRSKNYTV